MPSVDGRGHGLRHAGVPSAAAAPGSRHGSSGRAAPACRALPRVRPDRRGDAAASRRRHTDDRTPRRAPGRAPGRSVCSRPDRDAGPTHEGSVDPVGPAKRALASRIDGRARDRARLQALTPRTGPDWSPVFHSLSARPLFAGAVRCLDSASTLPALAPAAWGSSANWADRRRWAGTCASVVWNLGQHAQQRGRDGDRTGIAQRGPSLTLRIYLGLHTPGTTTGDALHAGVPSSATRRRRTPRWPRWTGARSSRTAADLRARRSARRTERGARRMRGGTRVPGRPSPSSSRLIHVVIDGAHLNVARDAVNRHPRRVRRIWPCCPSGSPDSPAVPAGRGGSGCAPCPA